MASPMEIRSNSMDDKKKTTKRKVFNDTWLKNKLFKYWLRRTSNENKASCSFCGIEMACKKSILIAHAKSQKHNKNSQIVDPTLPSTSDDERYVIDEKETKENTQKAEIYVAAYIAENNMAISSVDGLVALFNRISVMKGIAGNLAVSRKKCSNIIRNLLNKKQLQDFSQNLNDNKFSILVIGESTTTAGNKLLCILVKYVAPNKDLITELFELVNLDVTDFAIASDNASVIVGKHDSFATRLRKVNPNLILLNCICHTSALIASKACAQLPKYSTDFLHSVGTYCSCSPKSDWILKQMAMCFLKPDALNNITINSMVPDNILPTLSIEVGDNCQNLLNTLNSDIVLKIKSNCLLFYKTATAEIIERLPYCDKFFCNLKILNPEIALSKKATEKFDNLNDLHSKFNLDDLVNNINQEWLDLPNLFNDEDIEILSLLTVENMWKEIFS
ncbi:hypothetical protein PV325_008129, partial [Microctonus aethiopoides]